MDINSFNSRIQEIRFGRNRYYVLAQWDKGMRQWYGPMNAASAKVTGQHTVFAQTLGELVNDPNACTFRNRAAAERAARSIYRHWRHA